MNRKKIVAGNWKMNKTVQESLSLVTEIKGIVNDEVLSDTEVVIFPSFVSLAPVANLLKGSKVKLGAQTMSEHESGAFTGEVSLSMIKSTGATAVIIGHSERREYFLETNELLNVKVLKALNEGVQVFYCVGEKKEEREGGSHFSVVEKQIREGLKGVKQEMLSNLVIAYEPVWAIGTGLTASPEQAQEMHEFIRKILSDLIGDSSALSLSILYGGSVKPDNAKELFSKKDIDGGLIGGAALNARDFVQIIKAC